MPLSAEMQKQAATGEMLEKIKGYPLPVLLASVEKMIEMINDRVGGIKDWDDKSKTLRQIRLVGAKVYFFAEKEEVESDGTSED